MRRIGDDGWLDAKVPGSVYTNLLNNGRMDDPYFRDNEDKARALMDYDYEYFNEFKFVEDKDYQECDEIFLVFDMIDTVADIYLNEEHLLSVANMHRRYEIPVKELLMSGRNRLRVIIHSPNKFIRSEFEKDPVLGAEDCSRGFPKIRKAHYMFGWDWGPRLPDAGLQGKVSFLYVKKAFFSSFYVKQEHTDGKVYLTTKALIKEAGKKTEIDLLNPDSIANDYVSRNTLDKYQVRVNVFSPNGDVIAESVKLGERIEISNPKLWWPNGYGKHPLYRVKAELVYENEDVVDVWDKRIGLRTMEISREKDQYGEEFAHKVNGIKIFAMGADYIPQDNILGRVNKDRTRKLLETCVMSNFNCIRVWGGGYYPEDDFYDICDELGLVVWQDLMFACAVYRLSEDFEENIVEEVRENVRRLRHHASLGLWCGNNEMELFVGQGTWGAKNTLKSDYVKMYEYLFPKILKKEDPQTFYWPASPSSGGGFDNPNDENRGDVHYWEVWHGNQPFTAYRSFYFRYLSEFGFQSFPSVKTIESFTEPKDRNIFSYVMEKHQRNSVANGKIMNYMSQTFRYPESLDQLVYYSQLLQAEAIRYGVEHFRRNRGRCMGTVYWQLNDCWPVASWSSIDYYGRWKALQYYAKRFFAPLMISCAERGYLDQCVSVNDEIDSITKSIRLNIANETLSSHGVTVCWQLRDAYANVLRQEKESLVVDKLSSLWLPEVELSEALLHDNYVSYQLTENGNVISEGTVLFCPPKHFNFVEPNLNLRVEGDEIVVSASAYAKSVAIFNEEDNLILSDNYFDLNAGERRVKVISGSLNGLKLTSI